MLRWIPFAIALCWRVSAQPASLAGFSDAGAFVLYANEERVGRLTFEWKANGAFESKIVLSLAGQSTSGTVTITPDAEGRWTKAVVDDPSKKRVWEREGDAYRFTFADKSGSGHWPEDALTLDTWTPPLLMQALRRFDKAGDAAQTFPVVLLNDDILSNPNLVVQRQETMERTAGGRRLKLTRWVCSPAAHEFHVLADQDGRVYLVSGITGMGVPEQYTVFVREGFEELRERPSLKSPVSQPDFEVELRSGISVPMRDGVKLSTDLYLPAAVGKSPVILIRTPYKKEMEVLQARYFARRGYTVAVQDVRGRFASEGKWEPFVNEAKDGYDAIEWLARQSWSTGKVGMIGASYVGWVQWWAASMHPPHLAAMIPNVSPPDPFHNLPFDNGALGMWSILWVDRVESNATADLSGAMMAAIGRLDTATMFKTLPVINIDKTVLGKESAYWRRWMTHPFSDKYWADAVFMEKLKTSKVPVFHQSGWFDGDGIGSKLNYTQMAAYGHAVQKLTIGPWEHTDTAGRRAGKWDFGSAAAVDLQTEYLRWFDHWLKGVDNGITREPLVSVFVMGSNRWLTGPRYPLPETRFEKLYLTSGGSLSFAPPGEKEPADHYVYDPGDPTPAADNGEHPEESRKDMLVYTSKPFEKPYTMAGPLSAVLYASTSARDTDWFVQVLDVDEAGKTAVLWPYGEGHIRARYRKSLTKPELLTPGKVYRYEIDLWQTGVTFAAGHRLRVVVASAAFPVFDRNLNTGGNNETESRFVTAEQSVFHDRGHASYVLLPKIDEPPMEHR